SRRSPPTAPYRGVERGGPVGGGFSSPAEPDDAAALGVLLPARGPRSLAWEVIAAASSPIHRLAPHRSFASLTPSLTLVASVRGRNGPYSSDWLAGVSRP